MDDCYLCGGSITSQDEVHEVVDGVERFRHASPDLCRESREWRQGDPNTVHVYPSGDLVEHDTNGSDCVCGPSTEAVPRPDGSNGWLVTHHSLDGREKDETP